MLNGIPGICYAANIDTGLPFFAIISQHAVMNASVAVTLAQLLP